jgi:hypothetical protein
MDVFNVIKKNYFIFDVFWELPELPKVQKNKISRHDFFFCNFNFYFFSIKSITLFYLPLKF